jgi:hypothetical protein
MRSRPAPTRAFAAVLLPLALWSAIPAARWCPLDWSQVCSVQFLRCAAGLEAAADCVPMGGCPLARATSGSSSACANSAGSATRATSGGAAPCEAPAPGASHGRRAYCLEDPLSGRGLTEAGPRVHQPGPLRFVLAAVVVLPATESGRHGFVTEPRERGPTRSWAPLPPARAPPADG